VLAGGADGLRAQSEEAVTERRNSEMTVNHVVPPETPNWSELLSRTVDDLSRIARTEMELLAAVTKRLLEAQTEKLAGAMVLLIAISHGSLFVLGGVVLLLHLWLWWWLSFLITGFTVMAAGLVFWMAISKAAEKQPTSA
jgi:hypothetical protein